MRHIFDYHRVTKFRRRQIYKFTVQEVGKFTVQEVFNNLKFGIQRLFVRNENFVRRDHFVEIRRPCNII